jgi:hypothetical protein
MRQQLMLILALAACTQEPEDSAALADTDETDVPACETRVYYVDGDGDGYGDNASVRACERPEGYAESNDDCDDDNPGINPGMPEECDGLNLDEDCDGLVDDGDDEPSGQTEWYFDGDMDGFGVPPYRLACDPGPGPWVANGDDCNDADPDAGPC